ncbi:MAG: hypothetical protein WA973_18130 [Mesorhizobium sp.]|jgi:hypothetical protein
MSGEKNEAGKQVKQTTVRLKAFYSGRDGSLTPGTVIALDADEADRLIGLGAAVAHKDEAKTEEKA